MASFKGLAKTAIDPLGLGYGDAIFGAGKGGPSYDAEEAEKAAALAKGQQATDDFAAGGAPKFTWDTLGSAEQQGDTELGDISTDPRYKDTELAALSSLEDQGKNGFTAQNRADQVESENSVNRANRGRIGAIQQNMQARGAGGGGMDLIAQLQSAQDANETQALRALETESNKERAQTDAMSRAGSLAQSLQGQEYNQAANKAAAQDAINRFNTNTTNQVSQYNNQGANGAAHDTTSGAYSFRKDVLGANQAQAGLNYNAATEAENQKRIGDAAKAEAASGKMGAALGIAGGVVGGVYGGPAGAAAGSQVGSAAGRQVGSTAYKNQNGYWHGGKVPDDATVPGDDPRNDTHQINVAGGEIVVPRTAAQSPAMAAQFAAKAAGADDADVVGHLLAAMSKLHGRGK